MRTYIGAWRVLRSGGIAFVFALTLLTTVASPADANCDPPIASFPDYAPKADRIVIGDVVSIAPGGTTDADGRSSRFTLHVLYTVRGVPVRWLTVRDLPFAAHPIPLFCTDCLIMAKLVDRIALAMHVRDTADSPPNVIAWIGGEPPETACWDSAMIEGVFELAGKKVPLPATSTLPLPSSPPVHVPSFLLASSVLSAVAGLVVLRRRSQGR